jgi:hypothetical protein
MERTDAEAKDIKEINAKDLLFGFDFTCPNWVQVDGHYVKGEGDVDGKCFERV